MSVLDVKSYRAGLSIFDAGSDNGLFLNFAATAPVARPVLEKMKQAVEEMRRPLGDHLYQALNNLEFARRDVAEFIGAQPKEIAFTQNTSTAMSTIALSIDWKPGDRVLVGGNEFPSNFYPWTNLKHRGVEHAIFHPQANVPIIETLKQMDLKNVKAISLSAVSFETGRLYELKEFANFCGSHQIFSCLDAIQAIGTIPFDVKQIGVDFVGTGAQKWLMGPVGCGIIYARAELLSKLNVPFVGWTSVKYPEYMELGPLEFFPEMARFEPGLPNYVSIIGTAAALSGLKELGFQKIFSRIRDNSIHLQNNLKSMGLKLLTGEQDLFAGIVSFELPQAVTHRQAEEAYVRENIKITTRSNYVRVSPHFFNERTELDLFLEKTENIFHTKSILRSKTKIPNEKREATNLSKIKAEEISPKGKILITGATGSLAGALSREFLKRGYCLHLLARTNEALEAEVQKLRSEYAGATITKTAMDFASDENIEKGITQLVKEGPHQYAALVNCAGFAETSLFHDQGVAHLKETFAVNIWAPLRLTHAFLTDLKHPEAIGVLNIVSSTGRCGNPLLAAYGASNGALWTLGESLSREWADRDLTFTTFVAPAMHSPMQKRMGRVALRYFRIDFRKGNQFDYATNEKVAAEAVESLLRKKSFHLSPANRTKIFFNALFPESVSKKIKKVWRAEEND